MKLTPRLTLTFIIYAAALLSVVGALAYNSGRNSLRSATISELSATAIEKQAALNEWVEEKQKDITALSADPTVIEEASILMAAIPNSPEAQTVHDRFLAKIQPRVVLGEFLVVMLINPQTGEVIAATDASEEGKFQEDRLFFINGKLASYVQNVYYSVTLQDLAMTASAPLIGSDGQLLGVLAGRIDLEEMNRIINRRSGLRATDDAFLVNTSNLFVTQPYLVSDPAVLQKGVHTEAVNRCLTRTSGAIEADDYRGMPAIINYRWLPKRELCLIVKIDQAEAYAPSRAFGRAVAGISVLALLVAVGLAFILSRSLTRPILALQSGAAHFRQGELDKRLPETSRDELGTLAHEFNQMAASLSEKDKQLRTYSFELEKRVEERTEEIHRLNEELEERVKLRTAQLEAINKELESFSYSVSHDLRAPLRSIDGFSKILLEDYGEQIPPEGRQYLDRVRASAQHMAELIDDLLKLARITRAPMQLQLINLSEIVEGVASGLREQNPDRNLTVSITPDLTVNGDPALLKIALENLLSNAWKFTSKKNQALVEFGMQNKDGEQTFFIRDNGAGFDMAYVNKLFGVFQRLHSISEYPGTGVGLATVQRIIKIHGGHVWAEGEEGKGATFYFTL